MMLNNRSKINLANGEKGFVIKRFYEFFDLAVSQYGELNKKDKYIKLLSDNFDNWITKPLRRFLKTKQTKENGNIFARFAFLFAHFA